jgi:hypothetical protein
MDRPHTTLARLPFDHNIFMVSTDLNSTGEFATRPLSKLTKPICWRLQRHSFLLDLFPHTEFVRACARAGFPFFDEKDELLAHLPSLKPGYRDRNLSPYADVRRIGPNERQDPFHYARSLIRPIARFPGIFDLFFCRLLIAEEHSSNRQRADVLHLVQRFAWLSRITATS